MPPDSICIFQEGNSIVTAVMEVSAGVASVSCVHCARSEKIEIALEQANQEVAGTFERRWMLQIRNVSLLR